MTDHEFFSMPTLVPELADTCVVLNGVAKTYAMTGWRVGWIIAPARPGQGPDQPPVAPDLQRRRGGPASRHWPPCQGDLSAVGEMRRVLRPASPGDALDSSTAMDGVDCLAPQGAFYAFPSLEGVIGRTIGGVRRSPRRSHLAAVALEHAHVAFVPGEAFGSPGYARFSFALGDDDLGEGLAPSRRAPRPRLTSMTTDLLRHLTTSRSRVVTLSPISGSAVDWPRAASGSMTGSPAGATRRGGRSCGRPSGGRVAAGPSGRRRPRHRRAPQNPGRPARGCTSTAAAPGGSGAHVGLLRQPGTTSGSTVSTGRRLRTSPSPSPPNRRDRRAWRHSPTAASTPREGWVVCGPGASSGQVRPVMRRRRACIETEPGHDDGPEGEVVGEVELIAADGDRQPRTARDPGVGPRSRRT